MTMIARVAAAEAVLARFNGAPLVWGHTDCARLAAASLRALGHRVSLGRFGRYSSAAGALRALKRQGFDGLDAAIDAQLLPRIPPAAALPGDLVALPSDEPGWPALTVALGNGRVLGFREKDGALVCGVLQPNQWLCAWRVEPCRK